MICVEYIPLFYKTYCEKDMSELKVIKFECLDSTNEYAKKIIKNNEIDTPVVIIADTQTAGKTTKKTSWFSPKGNLYMTLVLKMENIGEKFLPQLSFISALSLVEVIKSITEKDVNIQIKWPNDVLLDVMKLSGILIEKEGNFAIIGIGVNVLSHPDRKDTVYPTVALIDKEIIIEKNDLGILLSKKILDNVNVCVRNGFENIIDRIKPFMIKYNEEIDFELNGEFFSGIFTGINKNGGLCLEIPATKEQKVFYSGNMYIYRMKK